MTAALLALLLAAAPAPAFAQAGESGGGVINLPCLDALNAIEHGWLAGVFSFVSEKDSATAFADMAVRNKKVMGSYLDKLARDAALTGGITSWDHEVLIGAQALYASPLAESFPKLGPTVKAKLQRLAMAPTMTLAELKARKGGRP